MLSQRTHTKDRQASQQNKMAPRASTIGAAMALGALLSSGPAFGFVCPAAPRAATTTTRLHAAAGTVAATGVAGKVEAVHDKLVEKLVAGLQVEATDYPASLEMASFAQGGVKGQVAGYKGNTRLVWSGEGKVASEDGARIKTDVAIFVGPLTVVPHIVMSLGVDGDDLSVYLDYIAREDAAYVTGNNYLETYYKGATREAAEAASAAAKSSTVLPSFYARVLQSPAAVSVTLPANDDGVAKAQAWADAHVDRWLTWLAEAKETDRMKRGVLLSRDNGIRRTWVEGQALLLNAFMGGADPTLAKQVAIAQSGPQQEAYVGGYS